jgi:hypothetical protein
MSRARRAGYAQFLLKTLLKRVDRARGSRANPKILAVCTILVRPSQIILSAFVIGDLRFVTSSRRKALITNHESQITNENRRRR